MRRSPLLLTTTLLSCFALTACEDGPTQPYSPSPNGAGDRWNNGATPPAVDPGKQGFGSQTGGTNKQEICTGEEKATRWKAMVKLPIMPPTTGGGLDLSGGTTWKGLTIDEAEKINCQSTNLGDAFGDGTQTNYWGDNQEVLVDYKVSTRKIGFMLLLPGYIGTVDSKSRDGKDTFKVPVNTQLTKNGKPYSLDWNSPVKFDSEVNELYDAMISTYAPALPQDSNCIGTGACIIGYFGDVAFIGFAALGSYWWVGSVSAPQPTPSIFNRIDQFLAKTLPFSLGNPLLKLDAEGPIAAVGLLGAAKGPCTLKMGLSFDNFLSNCVKVTTDTPKNDVEYNKLIGGISHNSERFGFDVQGVDLNFTDTLLAATDIVHDKDVPQPADVATEFSADQSTLGKIANDFTGNDATKPKDLHGAGLVYLEYARLVQDALSANVDPANRRTLGDPACLTGIAPGTDIDPNNPVFPVGCTGFEGFITASPVTGDPALDRLALGYGVIKHNKKMQLGLKPGHPQATFCLDANGDAAKGYTACAAPLGAKGDLFATSFARALQVFGQGKLSNMPIDVQDVRFFWKQYFTALVKYFLVAGSANETPAGVHAQVVDPNNVFFDSIGAGQFEIGEYVDRRFASKTQVPTDLVITADVKNGIFDAFEFSRDLYRGEEAIYSAVLENPADGLGQENSGTLTNVFGSPVLKAGWADTAKKSAYYCATHNDPAPCGGQTAPLDALGNMILDTAGDPILKPYPGAFSATGSVFTLGPSTIKVTKTYANIQSAMVDIPLFQNPYDNTSTAMPHLQKLIPWSPKQPGIGFPIALTGTLDKFVETSQLDFSGTTITANVDYDAVIDPKTMLPAADGSIQFLAVETTDFLGDVFLCQDPATGDLLTARMYTPVASILNWLQSHPGATSACQIIIRYSPFDNYVDYITSLANGVRLGITQGGGFGRVVDGTLFVPGQ